MKRIRSIAFKDRAHLQTGFGTGASWQNQLRANQCQNRATQCQNRGR